VTLAPLGTGRPVITTLIDEATIAAIAGEAWVALVGADEVLVPRAGDLPAEPLSAWVDIAGPWTGSVVLTTGRQTAADLTRALLGEAAPELLDHEDVADAFGEIANVVGGNVKAALTGPATLGLPRVGEAPVVRDPEDVCRLRVLWRGRPLVVSVQGAPPSLPVPHPPHGNHPHENHPHENGASL
jgi:chemotaxis protein CheX